MAELFESYDSDLAQILSSVSSQLDQNSGAGTEVRKAALRRAEMEAEEADEILSQMDIEVQSIPQSVRSRYAVRLRASRAELDKLRKEVRTKLSTSSGTAPYSDYDSRASGDLEADAAQAQRQRLLRGTATLEDGTRRLEESNRIALETEDLGADILRDLRGQREQIENSRNTLQQADSNIDRSSRTLGKMIRLARQQKVITIAIIVVLVLLILLILYSKLF